MKCLTCNIEKNGVEIFICNYCKKPHCEKHRLPEEHDCKAIKKDVWDIDVIEDIVKDDKFRKEDVKDPVAPQQNIFERILNYLKFKFGVY